MRAFSVALRPTGAWVWRIIECFTSLPNLTLLLSFAGSAVLSVWAFVEMSDIGLGLLWPRYALTPATTATSGATATATGAAAAPHHVVDGADDLLFVVSGICAFATFAGLRSTLGHEQVLQFPSAGHGPSHRVRRAKSAFVRAILASARIAILFVAVWSALYALVLGRSGGTLPTLLRSTGLATARTLTAFTSSEAVAAAAHALQASVAVSATAGAAAAVSVSVYAAAAFRLAYWVVILNVMWQWSRVMCDLFYTEPLAFDTFLLKALVDTRNPYARHLAFLDLQDVAEFSIARRRDIFAPLIAAAAVASGNGNGSAAGSGGDRSLLDADNSSGSRSGGTGDGTNNTAYFLFPSRAEVQSICRPIVVTTGTNELAIGVSRNARGGSSGSSLSFSNFAFDGASSSRRVVTALDERCDRVLATPWALVLETCLSVVSGLTDALYVQIGRRTAGAAGVTGVNKTANLWIQLFDSDAADAYGVFVPSAEQRAEHMFATLPTVTAAIQSVSMLAVAALNEDVSGIGAQSVGDILCTLLSCSMALDEYTSSPNFISSRVALRLHGQQALRPAVLQLAFSMYCVAGCCLR